MELNLRNKVDEYVKKVAVNDTKAFDELYDMLKDRLICLAKNYSLSDEDAEEIVHDVFTLLVKKAPYFMYYNNCYNLIVRVLIKKSLSLRKKLINQNENMKTMSFPAYIKFNESKAHLFIEIQRLPTEHLQKLFIYRFYCKLRIGELEKLLKTSRSSIYRDIKIGLAILREKLK